jgi:hypothetical protein
MRIELRERFTSTEDLGDSLRLEYRKERTELNRGLAVYAMGVAVFACVWFTGGLDDFGLGTFATCSIWGLTIAWHRFYRFPYVVPREHLKRLAELGEVVTVLDDSGMHERGDTMESFIKWDAVTWYLETDDGFLIHFLGGQGKYSRKRLLADDEVRWLQETLRARTGEGAK